MKRTNLPATCRPGCTLPGAADYGQELRTSLSRDLIFQSELKILDLARHGGAEFNLAGRQAIEHGISMGRGSVWLKYAKLRG